MWANFDHATDPNSTVVAMMYKAKKTFAPGLARAWRSAQARPSVTLARSDRMKRSARTTRNGEWPSAATSTRMKNQNQYPPTRIISPPIHQRCGHMESIDGLNTITTVETTWSTNPYMVSRCATRRRALQNSPEASTSTTAVWTAIDTSSPPPSRREALPFDLRQLSKKYFALPLCTTSNSVPAATRTSMTMTKACMAPGGMDAESPANGLTANIETLLGGDSKSPPPGRRAEKSYAA